MPWMNFEKDISRKIVTTVIPDKLSSMYQSIKEKKREIRKKSAENLQPPVRCLKNDRLYG